MQFPDDDNGQLLAEISAAGVDLSKMQQIDFYILFEQQADAEKFATEIVNDALVQTADVEKCKDTGVWEPFGSPRPRTRIARRVSALAGMVSETGPAKVGTVALVPSTASYRGSASVNRKSAPSTEKSLCFASFSVISASPGRPPCADGSPWPFRRICWPGSKPAGTCTAMVLPLGICTFALPLET